MIIVENDGNRIYIFSRDETGNPTVTVDNNFKPYFYSLNQSGNFKSIFGDPLIKIICEDPGEISEMRKQYEHFEGDVNYTNRYIIDKFKTIPRVPIRKCYIDIETSSKGGWADIEKGNQPILSICVHDNFLNKKIFLGVLPSGIERKEQKGEEKSYYFFKDEKTLLNHFLQYIDSTNPDILIAWNGDGFDFPYIITRMKKLNLPINRLSRMNYVQSSKDRDSFKTIIKGRILFDLMWAYKKMNPGERESYSLEYISQYELKQGKEKYDGTLDDLYEKEFDKFVEYNIKDVELLVLLDEKLHMVEYFDEIRRFAHCHFLDVYESTKVHDALLLMKAREKSVVLPSKSRVLERETPEGAFVHDAPMGLFDDVAVGDLKSLYPSIMITFNLSPEMLLQKYEENCINIDNKFYFKKTEKGIIPNILEEVLRLRDEAKKERKKHSKDTTEYKSLNIKQEALKIIANSLFGAMAYPGFRFYRLEVADCILYTARRVIKHSIDHLESKKNKVIYSDTDSVFFLLDGKSINETKNVIEGITKSYDNFVKQFNVDNHILQMQFEKVFKKILFVGVKKRYAGIMRWFDGEEVDDIKIMGFESRRSDSPQIIRDFQKQLFNLVLRGASKEQVLKFVSDFKTKFYTLREDLGIPKGISQKPEEYKNLPIHIRAAKTSNERHGTNYTYGDKIKFLYIRKQPEGFNNFENVIAFQKKLPDGYMIDYDKMWETLVEKKVDLIKKSIGWESKSSSIFDF